jgi:hypothetical protein
LKIFIRNLAGNLWTFKAQIYVFSISIVIVISLIMLNNEPGGKMVWYPREMTRTNVSGVYPSKASGGLGQDYREEE